MCKASIAASVYQYLPKPRVIFTIAGAGHLEPCYSPPRYPNRADIPSGLFMACHLRGEYCDMVYGPPGGAPEICNSGATHPYSGYFTLSDCRAER